MRRVPLVNYLDLEEGPRLVAEECTRCNARFFGRRSACAACFGRQFREVGVPTTGTVTSFSIVSYAAPGVPVPYAPAVIDCQGTPVRGNIINTPLDPEHITLGMPVRLATYSLGADASGNEAMGFGFEPA